MSKEESAAVCIQSHFRGYLGRKLYLELLYEQYQKVGWTLKLCEVFFVVAWFKVVLYCFICYKNIL